MPGAALAGPSAPGELGELRDLCADFGLQGDFCSVQPSPGRIAPGPFRLVDDLAAVAFSV